MSILKNKIDFAAIISVDHANPNGDPLMEIVRALLIREMERFQTFVLRGK